MTQPHEPRLWEQIHLAGKPNRKWFKRILWVYCLLDYAFLARALHYGQPGQSVLGEFLASQLPIFFVGWWWENTNPIKNLDPRTQSWAFLGDYVGLGPLAAVSALAFVGLPQHRWFNDGYWWIGWAAFCLMVGAVLAAIFRSGEGDNYDVLRYWSFTKLLHNGVAFTVLSGMLVYTMIPLWFAGAWSAAPYYPEWATLCFGVWLAGSIADGIRAGLPEGHPWKLSAEHIHPQGDARGHRIEPELEGVPMWNYYHERANRFDVSWLLHLRKVFAVFKRA